MPPPYAVQHTGIQTYGGREPPIDWKQGEPGMSTAHHDRLLSLVQSAARRRGYACQMTGPDVVTLSGPTTFTLALGNMRRLAAARPADQWAALVADYVDTRAITIETDRDDPLDYTDFAAMRGLIRTRLYATESVGADVVRRVVAPGLIQRVLIDRVHTVTPVTYEMLRYWPISEFDLFTLAERNVRRDAGVEVQRHRFDVPLAENLPPISMLTGPEYLTAHARWLGDYPVTGRGGAVLIMPSKQSVYAYPVDGPEVVGAVAVLAQLAAVSYADEPWPINPWVYWWRAGHLELAATAHETDDSFTVRPTEIFDRFTTGLGKPPDN